MKFILFLRTIKRRPRLIQTKEQLIFFQNYLLNNFIIDASPTVKMCILAEEINLESNQDDSKCENIRNTYVTK